MLPPEGQGGGSASRTLRVQATQSPFIQAHTRGTRTPLMPTSTVAARTGTSPHYWCPHAQRHTAPSCLTAPNWEWREAHGRTELEKEQVLLDGRVPGTRTEGRREAQRTVQDSHSSYTAPAGAQSWQDQCKEHQAACVPGRAVRWGSGGAPGNLGGGETSWPGWWVCGICFTYFVFL